MWGFINKVFAYKFFDDLIFIYPLYAVMFEDYGLSILQISLIFAVWSATSFIFEVPSGILADKYSRKHLLIIGQLFRILGYLIWVVFPGFTGFLTGIVLWGIKGSLSTCTLNAMIYDNLKAYNQEAEYTRILGKMKSISMLAIIISSLSVSLIFSHGYTFVIISSIISLVISSIFLLMIKGVNNTINKANFYENYFAEIKKGIKLSFKDPNILKLIIFCSIVTGIVISIDELFPVFATGIGFPKKSLGFFLAFVSVFQALASFLAYKFEKLSNLTYLFLYMLGGFILFAVALIMQIGNGFMLLTLMMIVFIFLFTVIDIVLEGRLQKNIPSEIRATISSVKNFYVEIVVMLVFLLFGATADKSSFQLSFLLLSFIIILSGSFYLIFSNARNITASEAYKD